MTFIKKYKNILFIILISFIFLLIGSKNSPLYTFNDWWDANAFFTMGKGIFNGLVPYKDLFEQKGPLLYLYYGIGYLLNHSCFYGIFIIEVINLSFSLYFINKIFEIFNINNNKYLGVALFSGALISLFAFMHGGAAEEFTFPFIFFALYKYLSYINTKNITYKDVFLIGISAGSVLLIKYSLLGFHFIVAAFIFFTLIFNKDIKKAFISMFIYLLGMFIITIPFLLYFLFNDAINDFFKVYFYDNMFLYSSNKNIIEKIIIAFSLLFSKLIISKQYLLLITIPSIILLFNKKINLNIKVFTISSVLFTGFGTYIGGTNYFYYSLILAPFMIIGIILFLKIIDKVNLNKLLIPSIIVIMLIAYILSPNTSYLLKNKNKYAQFIFADIIEKYDDKTLLNYNMLDGGFYTTTNNLPNCYFFMRNNISYEDFKEMYETQDKCIKENKPAFVVTKHKYDILNDDYEIIKEHTQTYEDRTITYYLYKRK